jgi:hypothetical protein
MCEIRAFRYFRPTYTDQARFVGDNGLISTGFNANFTLTQT